jgi:hypothetical protein
MMKRTLYKYPTSNFKVDLFQNQIDFGKQIANEFLNRKILNILAIAPTQSGKTGSMLSLIKEMLSNRELTMPINNIFVITGLSSVEWMEQTKERFPSILHPHIYHRNNLDTFVKDIKRLKSALVIVDENQIAFDYGQSIHKAFISADLININSLYKKDIKIVQFSATPLNVADFKNSYSNIIRMIPPDDYVSIETLLPRVKRYKDLCGRDPLLNYSQVQWNNPETYMPLKEHIRENISEINLTPDPRYHIIRTPPSYLCDVVISNFIRVFGNNCEYIKDLDNFDLLVIPPEHHTFIFIKEKLRCAKTIPKKFLGVLYERVTARVLDHVIIQGLAGRMTGYHDNLDAVIFSNEISIRRYLKSLDNNFEDEIPRASFKFITQPTPHFNPLHFNPLHFNKFHNL